MPLDLRATFERFFRDRRRRTPRILRVVIDGADACDVIFHQGDRLDTNPEPGEDIRAVVRVFDEVLGVLEFDTNPTIVEDPAGDILRFVDPATVIGLYEGPRYALYMQGNVRGKRRFELRPRTRCDRVEDL